MCLNFKWHNVLFEMLVAVNMHLYGMKGVLCDQDNKNAIKIYLQQKNLTCYLKLCCHFH